ncbi:hypothetical protein L6164_007142 [Bauhinia variegata]|uniref:Uncharacterized protein n=1 Tax=Bauhinia variegata TaxID=167791 RepID=A0ACB9PWS6_BAUVA|nr:hypothetical protein L6164_007142 [Bauhinia variegata]
MITIIEDNVSMHDLMQEIGREIARESPRKHRWLWDHNDIYQVLKYNNGVEAVESISLNLLKIKKLHLSPQAFSKMYNLKFLNFYTNNDQSDIYLPEGLDSLPDELRLLQWDDYPSKSLPLTFCAENLVELSMQQSRVEKLWDGVQNHVNLNKIDLSWSRYLIELPNFTKAINLKYVHLQGCTSLCQVDPSILSLSNLAYLDLRHCKKLKSLRSHSHSRSLKWLSLHRCSGLKEFSVTSDEITYLDLGSTALDELPSSVGCLGKLKHLNLKSNQNLKLSDCEQLGGLVSLNILFLDGLRNSTELPHNIGLLSSLQQLSLNGSNVESLPTTIKHLSHLKSLVIRNCQRLQSLPELPPSLKHLDATECRSLKKVSTSAVKQLKGCNGSSKEIFLFRNCMNLDGYALNSIMAYAHVRIKQAANEFLSAIIIEDGDPYLHDDVNFSICLPGSQVPNWFSYRTTEASVTIELPPSSKFMSLVFSLVLNQFIEQQPDSFASVGCKCYFEASNGERDQYDTCFRGNHFPTTTLSLDHVFLWYDEFLCDSILEAIKESRATYQGTTYIPKITFEFFAASFHRRRVGKRIEEAKINLEIKECGICLICNSEHQQGTKSKRLWDVFMG